MDWLFYMSLLGLGCGALSGVTWFLFKPQTTFHAPLGKADSIFLFCVVGGTLIAIFLNTTNWMPAEFFPDISKAIPGCFTAIFLVVTSGRAAWHHIENATRTPRELWAAFFGS